MGTVRLAVNARAPSLLKSNFSKVISFSLFLSLKERNNLPAWIGLTRLEHTWGIQATQTCQSYSYIPFKRETNEDKIVESRRQRQIPLEFDLDCVFLEKQAITKEQSFLVIGKGPLCKENVVSDDAAKSDAVG